MRGGAHLPAPPRSRRRGQCGRRRACARYMEWERACPVHLIEGLAAHLLVVVPSPGTRWSDDGVERGGAVFRPRRNRGSNAKPRVFVSVFGSAVVWSTAARWVVKGALWTRHGQRPRR